MLNALKNLAVANGNKVMLELRIKVGGKMSVPFVTEGTAVSDLKVTLEFCLQRRNKWVKGNHQGDLFHRLQLGLFSIISGLMRIGSALILDFSKESTKQAVLMLSSFSVAPLRLAPLKLAS